MRRKRVICRIMVWMVAGVLGAGFFPSPGKAQEGKGQTPPLTMEELEVRGFRDKPGQLYFSVPDQVFVPAPVRFDLLAEDLAKPFLPWEIVGNPGRDEGKGTGRRRAE